MITPLFSINYLEQQGFTQFGPHVVLTTLDLEKDDWELQDLEQHTKLITPHVNTPTKITFNANSIQSLQLLNFSQFILYHLYFINLSL